MNNNNPRCEIIIPPTIPPSPPSSPSKNGNNGNEKSGKGKEIVSDVVKLERFLYHDPYVGKHFQGVDSRSRCDFCKCLDHMCHEEIYFDWIVYKYRDDPEYKYCTKEKLREVVFGEYHRLNNFDTYRRMKVNKHEAYPYNINHVGHVPYCVTARLDFWIKEKYDGACRLWCRERSMEMKDDPEKLKTWKKKIECPKEARRMYRKWLGQS